MSPAEASKSIPRLKFADKHKDRILKGEKTATIRIALEHEFPIGERFHLCDEDGERFASAIVEDREYTTVEMAARMDFDGHRNYRSTDELVEELREYYPNEQIGEQSRVELVYWDWEGLWHSTNIEGSDNMVEQTQHDEPVIEVDAATYDRFEEERKKTKTDHAPAMGQATFLSALLDTEEAVREGHYDDELPTETTEQVDE